MVAGGFGTTTGATGALRAFLRVARGDGGAGGGDGRRFGLVVLWVMSGMTPCGELASAIVGEIGEL